MGDFASQVTSRLDSFVLVSALPGADLQATEEDLALALADHPDVSVTDPSAVMAAARASMDQIFGLVTALLLLAVVIEVLGIVNALVPSVLERARELGLMRAVGPTRRQIRAIVRTEAVLMSGLGAGTGFILGTLFGIALSRALGSDGISQVRVPSGQLLIYLVVATALAALAALAAIDPPDQPGPACRAGRSTSSERSCRIERVCEGKIPSAPSSLCHRRTNPCFRALPLLRCRGPRSILP